MHSLTTSSSVHNPLSAGNQPARLLPACACAPARRGFLGGLLAAGAGTMLAGCASPAGSGVNTARDRIDTHHHLFSPAYVAELLSPESLRKTGYFEYEAVHKLIKYVQKGTSLRLPGPRLMVEMGLVGVLATQMWHHYFIDNTLSALPSYQMPQKLVA